MTEFLRQLWDSINKLSRGQKIALGGTVALVVVAIVAATMMGAQKEYVQLFEEELSAEDAGKVSTKLRELNVEFKVGAKPTDLRVPLTDKSYILLQLAQEKTLPQVRAGWRKLIDERSILGGQTQQEFDLNFIRGLQDELEAGLMRFASIENAKVYITKPKTEVFKEDQREPTAAVVLKLKPGSDIAKDQVRAIRLWISTAVEGLKPPNIRINDEKMRDLTRMIEDDEEHSLDKIKAEQYKYVKKTEADLEKKLATALEQIFGPGKAVVRVNCELDFDKKEAVSDIVVPPFEGSNEGAKLSEKIEQENYEGKDLTKDGEPGVNSNLPPGAPSYPGMEPGTNNKYERTAAIRNYDWTKSKEKYVKDQGTIKRMTVSVVVDIEPMKLATIMGTEGEEKLRALAQTTVGFEKKRGDALSFMAVPFNNDIAEQAKREMDERRRQEQTMFMIVVALLMCVPMLIGSVYIFVRVSRARALAREKAQLERAAVEAEALRKSEELRQQKLREQQTAERMKRFEDINNFFPEIKDPEEKKRRVQELRYKAYSYARDNERLPPDFDELSPEEQFLYQEAFRRKADGTLNEGIERLARIIGERDREHQEEMERLQAEAKTKMELEERVRNLVTSKPEDAIQVLRIWLEE